MAALAASPFGGFLAQKVGAKVVYFVAALTQALAVTAFGFVTFINNLPAFLIVSYLLRIWIGVTDGLAWVAAVSLLMAIYPKRIASIMAVTESIFGIGFAMGNSYLLQIIT